MRTKQHKVFLITLLVTDQLGISFNDARESSTALSHVIWVLFLLGQYSIKKGCKEKSMSPISWVFYWSRIELNTKEHLWTPL